jgi:hypothetical protein
VPLTFREDGLLHFGDNVMLKNCLTQACLVFDMSDRISSQDEAYACTSTKKELGPCARSVVTIERADMEDGACDDIVRYGQQIHISANPFIHSKKLYLHSQQISPLAYARFSRNQEVCLHIKKAYNTTWRIIPTNGVVSTKLGQPICANEPIRLEHCATSHSLSNDHITYRNDFGDELEVSCLNAATKRKGQILANETGGTHVRENTQKVTTD